MYHIAAIAATACCSSNFFELKKVPWFVPSVQNRRPSEGSKSCDVLVAQGSHGMPPPELNVQTTTTRFLVWVPVSAMETCHLFVAILLILPGSRRVRRRAVSRIAFVSTWDPSPKTPSTDTVSTRSVMRTVMAAHHLDGCTTVMYLVKLCRM